MWTPQLSRGREATKIRNRIKEWTIGKGLDVGCGLDKISPDTIGVDIAPLPGVDYTLDARDLFVFTDNQFDYVFSAHTLEDIDDTKDTLHEWLRVLQLSGHLILYLPHKDYYPNIGKEGANPAHKHDFIPNDILQVLKQICAFDVHVLEERNQNDEYSFLLVLRITAKKSNS